MKRRFALGSLAMVAAMTVAPVASQAGGMRHGCVFERLMHRAHAAPMVMKAAPAKKAHHVKVAAKKPMK